MKNGCEFKINCPYGGDLVKCDTPNPEKNMAKALGECAQIISEITFRQPSRLEQEGRDSQFVKLGWTKLGFVRSLNIVPRDLEDQEPQDPRFVEPTKSDLDL